MFIIIFIFNFTFVDSFEVSNLVKNIDLLTYLKAV